MTTAPNINSRITGDKLYNLYEPDFSELSTFPYTLKDIQNRKIDGVIIRNVLSVEEVNLIINNFKQIDEDEIIRKPEILIYPMGFSYYLKAKEANLEDYFIQGEKFNKSFPKRFEVDLEKRLSEVFEALSGGLTVSPAPSFNGEGNFAFIQIRKMLTGEMALPIHCGNAFQNIYEKFYEDLSQFVDVKNQMSFFIMLQPPDMGGELTLYDIIYENGQKMVSQDDMMLANGEIRSAGDKHLKRTVIKPKPGDLIIFSAGQIWHKVEPIRGEEDRITIGGFFAFSKDGKHVSIWV